jgi:hypothetical protein
MQYLAAYTLASLSGKEPSTNIFNFSQGSTYQHLKSYRTEVRRSWSDKSCWLIEREEAGRRNWLNECSWLRQELQRWDQDQAVALQPRLLTQSQPRNNNQRRKLKRKSQSQLRKTTISEELIFSDDPDDLCPFI